MKQIKLLGVLALALSLGLAACGGSSSGGNSSKAGGGSGSGSAQSGSRSTHQHTFDTSRWEADDNYHWHPATCEHTSQKGDRAAHEFGEPYDVVAAECGKAGSQKVKCSICQKEVTQTLPALEHDEAPAADSDAWTPITSPDCENPGSHSYVCSKCNKPVEVEIPALGHLYAKDETTGEDILTEVRKVTCTAAGLYTKACTRAGCDHVERVVKEALGHDLQPEPDDGVAPKEDFAKVRRYSCTHECGKSYFGFNANEVTAASKSHLVIDDNGGARFWGRPIGNDVELDENGSASESSHDAVFNENQPGDFFEYKFTLTDEQVGEYYLYCEATPAQWMRNNGLDFFAAKPNDTDWTRGMYTDDLEETPDVNEKGTEITDYRYILYVDDQPKKFDDSIKNPVTSDDKAEFILPYKFNLHSGDNSISLRMAGGYRSTFHKFTFRSVEEKEPEHEHLWDEVAMDAPAATDALVKKYVCLDPACTENVKYEIAVKDAKMALVGENDAWKNNPTDETKGYTMKINNDGGSAQFTFALPKGFTGKMYQRAYMDSYSNNKNKLLYWQTDNVSNVEVKVNGTAINMDAQKTVKFSDVFGPDAADTTKNYSAVKDVLIGDCALEASNTIIYKRVKTLNMVVSAFVFIGNEAA